MSNARRAAKAWTPAERRDAQLFREQLWSIRCIGTRTTLVLSTMIPKQPDISREPMPAVIEGECSFAGSPRVSKKSGTTPNVAKSMIGSNTALGEATDAKRPSRSLASVFGVSTAEGTTRRLKSSSGRERFAGVSDLDRAERHCRSRNCRSPKSNFDTDHRFVLESKNSNVVS